jgi:hypothetical protein
MGILFFKIEGCLGDKNLLYFFYGAADSKIT